MPMLEANTASGNARIAHTSGDASFSTASGDVSVGRVAGRVAERDVVRAGDGRRADGHVALGHARSRLLGLNLDALEDAVTVLSHQVR